MYKIRRYLYKKKKAANPFTKETIKIVVNCLLISLFINWTILSFCSFSWMQQQQWQIAVFLRTTCRFGTVLTFSPTKCAKHVRGCEVNTKKHVFSYSLPFLISSLGVSMATKSLSGGSLSADAALTSIKSLTLSLSVSSSLYVELLSHLSDTRRTVYM